MNIDNGIRNIENSKNYNDRNTIHVKICGYNEEILHQLTLYLFCCMEKTRHMVDLIANVNPISENEHLKYIRELRKKQQLKIVIESEVNIFEDDGYKNVDSLREMVLSLVNEGKDDEEIIEMISKDKFAMRELFGKEV